ncbi:hypothetical protein Goshw_002989, partial [Gossypium schwendimanii]|nr:hypothetical protein [Gossypium schwendimanii]
MGGLSVLVVPEAILRVLRIAHWHPPTALLEALVLLSVLEFAQDLGLSQVVFERDSLHVIRKLNSTQADRSEIWALVIEG